MPTTSNFGWTTPADTDLVKDGAAAIRTLGNGIDTSLVDLKGGTTGQVLTKATNADLDYTWTTPQVGDITEVAVSSPITGGGTSGSVTIGIQDATTAQKGAVQLTNSVSSTSTTTAATPSSVKSAYDLADAAIAKSFVNAKGDLISASANDTPAILTAGANGETLVADSSQTAGLRYNPPVGSLANPVINGGMDIWQRGTSFTVGTASPYTADRWQANRNGTVAGLTVSRQTTSDTTNLPNIQYSARIQRDSGNTSTAANVFWHNLETVNSIPFAGKTITLSFYARAGANFSSASNQITAQLFTGTGTDQNINVTGYTGSTTAISQNTTLTTTWQRFTYTATLSSSTTQIGLVFFNTPVGTAGANDWFEITGIQLDVGTWTASTAPTFRRSGATLAGEVSACERYYQIVTGQMCSGSNTTTVYSGVNFRTQMRTAPTVALSAAMTITDAGADYTQSSANVSIVSSRANERGAQISMANFTGTTAHRPYSTTVTSAQIQFSAEL